MTDPRMTPTNDAPVTVEQHLREARSFLGTVRQPIPNRAAAADEIDKALAALASAPAGDGVEDEYTYDELWQAIADATRIKGGAIAISVKAFRDSIRDTGSAAALARPRAAVGDMEWLSSQRRLSLDFYSPMYGDDDDQSEEWRVTRESGPINDREWDVIGRGATVAEAVSAARHALQSPPAKVEG